MCGSSTEHELARGGHVSHTLTHTLREAAATAGKNTALLFDSHLYYCYYHYIVLCIV